MTTKSDELSQLLAAVWLRESVLAKINHLYDKVTEWQDDEEELQTTYVVYVGGNAYAMQLDDICEAKQVQVRISWDEVSVSQICEWLMEIYQSLDPEVQDHRWHEVADQIAIIYNLIKAKEDEVPF